VPYVGDLGPGANAGVLFAASALGMLAGDLVLGRFVAPANRERLVPWLALLLGAPMLAFVTEPGLGGAATLFALATFGFAYHLGRWLRPDGTAGPVRSDAGIIRDTEIIRDTDITS
jgi:hypothetical protein